MTISSVDIIQAIKASIDAGIAILSIYNSDYTIELKEDLSPLTQADKESHKIIFDQLSSFGLPILSEEGRGIPYPERKNWNRFWLVDPLDGTKEFIKKNDEFTVNIALIENNFPVLGIIYVPVYDILYFSVIKHGAYKLENTTSIFNPAEPLSDLILKSKRLPLVTDRPKYTIVASRSHLTEETEEFIENSRKKYGNVDIKSKGSSLKFCLVAEGEANVYPRFGPTSEWDTGAGQSIVEEAGGEVVQVNENERLRYNKKDLLNPWFIVNR